MGILSRLLLFFYVLVVMAAAVAIAGVCLNVVPTNLWQKILQLMIKSQETLIVLAIMMLASLCLLSVVFSGKKTPKILSTDIELKKDATSEVKITIEALAGVVERAALTVAGVRQVRASVYRQAEKSPIKVQLEIILSQGYTAQIVSEEVNNAVSKALNTTAQLSGVPIEIKVTEVTHAIIERERRVV